MYLNVRSCSHYVYLNRAAKDLLYRIFVDLRRKVVGFLETISVYQGKRLLSMMHSCTCIGPNKHCIANNSGILDSDKWRSRGWYELFSSTKYKLSQFQLEKTYDMLRNARSSEAKDAGGRAYLGQIPRTRTMCGYQFNSLTKNIRDKGVKDPPLNSRIFAVGQCIV